MTAIEEVYTRIVQYRNETWHEPVQLSVSRDVYKAVWHECLQSMQALGGNLPDIPMPDHYILYGVRIVSEQVSDSIIRQINGVI